MIRNRYFGECIEETALRVKKNRPQDVVAATRRPEMEYPGQKGRR